MSEKIGENKYQVTITVKNEDFQNALEKAYNKDKAKYNVPGFRKGKATQKMIEKMFGDGVFYQTAFDMIYWEAFVKACQEEDLKPVEMPEIDIREIGRNVDLVFNASFHVQPTVELTDEQYKGIELEEVEYSVTADSVNARVEQEREKLARFVDVKDRAVKDGDQLIIDYAGSVDSVPFDGGSAQNQPLVIGSNRFIPGFEEQLVGMNIEEERDITVTFPKEYHAEELAGKEAVFHVTVHEIKEKQLPELDDEFAKDVSDFDTLDEYKKDIEAKLLEATQAQAKNQIRAAAVDKLVSNVEVEIPPSMTERQIDYTIENMRYRMQAQGLSLEDYMRYTNTDMEKLRADVRSESEKRVKSDLILEQIVLREGIKASQEDIDNDITAYAKQSGQTFEQIKNSVSERDIQNITIDIEARKAIDFVVENAKMVKPAPKEEISKEVSQVVKETKKALRGRPKKKKDEETAE